MRRLLSIAAGIAMLGGVGILSPLLAQQAKRRSKPTPQPSPRQTAFPAAAVTGEGYKSSARPFLDRYCVSCHAGPNGKGSFRADASLSADFTDRATQAKWSEAVNQLNSHLMPPKGSPQPPAAEVSTFVDWIVSQTVAANQARRDTSTVLRRLTRDEYRNSLAELTGVAMDVSGFPADPPAGGFDNNARALTVSPLHVELYAATARQALDQALVPEGAAPPPKVRWHFDPKVVPMDSRRVRLDEANTQAIVNGNNNREEGDFVTVHNSSWDTSVDARDFRLPVAGTYIVRLRAAGRVPARTEVVAAADRILARRRDQQLRENPNGARWHNEQYENDLRHFRTDPMYAYGPPRVRVVQHLGPTPRTVAEYDVPATVNAPQVYETKVRFTTEPAGVNFLYAYSIPIALENFWCQNHASFARPELLIDWFEIEGPVLAPGRRSVIARSFSTHRCAVPMSVVMLAKSWRRSCGARIAVRSPPRKWTPEWRSTIGRANSRRSSKPSKRR